MPFENHRASKKEAYLRPSEARLEKHLQSDERARQELNEHQLLIASRLDNMYRQMEMENDHRAYRVLPSGYQQGRSPGISYKELADVRGEAGPGAISFRQEGMDERDKFKIAMGNFQEKESGEASEIKGSDAKGQIQFDGGEWRGNYDRFNKLAGAKFIEGIPVEQQQPADNLKINRSLMSNMSPELKEKVYSNYSARREAIEEKIRAKEQSLLAKNTLINREKEVVDTQRELEDPNEKLEWTNSQNLKERAVSGYGGDIAIQDKTASWKASNKAGEENYEVLSFGRPTPIEKAFQAEEERNGSFSKFTPREQSRDKPWDNIETVNLDSNGFVISGAKEERPRLDNLMSLKDDIFENSRDKTGIFLMDADNSKKISESNLNEKKEGLALEKRFDPELYSNKYSFPVELPERINRQASFENAIETDPNFVQSKKEKFLEFSRNLRQSSLRSSLQGSPSQSPLRGEDGGLSEKSDKGSRERLFAAITKPSSRNLYDFTQRSNSNSPTPESRYERDYRDYSLNRRNKEKASNLSEVEQRLISDSAEQLGKPLDAAKNVTNDNRAGYKQFSLLHESTNSRYGTGVNLSPESARNLAGKGVQNMGSPDSLSPSSFSSNKLKVYQRGPVVKGRDYEFEESLLEHEKQTEQSYRLLWGKEDETSEPSTKLPLIKGSPKEISPNILEKEGYFNLTDRNPLSLVSERELRSEREGQEGYEIGEAERHFNESSAEKKNSERLRVIPDHLPSFAEGKQNPELPKTVRGNEEQNAEESSKFGSPLFNADGNESYDERNFKSEREYIRYLYNKREEELMKRRVYREYQKKKGSSPSE